MDQAVDPFKKPGYTDHNGRMCFCHIFGNGIHTFSEINFSAPCNHRVVAAGSLKRVAEREKGECAICFGNMDRLVGTFDVANNIPVSKHRPFGLACRSGRVRSEEHTSELQSRGHLVCRLLLEKKKNCDKC